jgi:sucrose-6-phosphate hydrolase SacC (GH32 family)
VTSAAATAVAFGGIMTSIARTGEGHGEPRAPLYREALRPQFHFTARYWKDYRLGPDPHQEGWMNDMNGLVWNDGVYHLFCQRWWSAWLHAVGTDLVHWEELEPAFGKGGRFGGTQSGGCVVDRENSSGLGDGTTPPMVAFWSSTDNANQCISYSRDRGRTWRKYERNPVLAHPYRDPNVFWYGPARKWIMILYGPAGEKGGGAGRCGFNGELDDAHDRYLLFSSTNLLEWAKLDSSIPDSFECPDMFPLAVEGERREAKWVVVDGRGDYLVGRFDGERFAAEQAKRRGDLGRNFYATMTFDNMPERDGRRVQMAWMRDMDGYPKDMPFSQQASFPCELTLRRLPEGFVLCRNPVREIEKLHVQKLSLGGRDLGEGENPLGDIEGESFDIRAEIDVAGSTCDRVVFRLRGNTVTYDLRAKRLASHGSETALPPRSGAVEIRILVDRLSLETFGNRGEVSITNVARQADSRPHLSLRAVGGVCRVRSLAARGVKSIWE